jgi:hypothetical protein
MPSALYWPSNKRPSEEDRRRRDLRSGAGHRCGHRQRLGAAEHGCPGQVKVFRWFKSRPIVVVGPLEPSKASPAMRLRVKIRLRTPRLQRQIERIGLEAFAEGGRKDRPM